MLFYDWEKIFKVSKGDPEKIILITTMLTFDIVPENSKDRFYALSKHNYSGSSFLVHPDILLLNSSKHSLRDMARYIGLASYRNFARYLAGKNLTLEIEKSPFDPRKVFDDPTMVPVKDGRIHFLYEDTNLQTLH